MGRLLSLLFLGTVLFFEPVFASNYIVRLQTNNPLKLANDLSRAGLDVVGSSMKYQTVEVVVKSLERIHAFQEKGLDSGFSILSAIESRPYRHVIREQGRNSLENYYDPDTALELMQRLETAFPNWVKVFELNSWLGLEKTADGRSLYALQVSRQPGVIEDEPKVAVVAQHHAREIVTHHAVLDAATDLLERVQRGDSQAIQWLENSAIWFVPIVNPDGLAHVFDVDQSWRKNRSFNSGGSRGVDLNRNYEFKWGSCGMHSPVESSSVFKGPSALSEIETQVMDRLNNKLRFQYLVSYHSYGDQVLYPYLCGEVAESKVYDGLRDELAEMLGFERRKASSSGEDFEHHYARYGTLAFLIEIGYTFQPTFETYKNDIWPTMRKTLPYLLEQAQQSYVHIRVKDGTTGEPLPATLQLAGVTFQEGETRIADLFGSYRWRLVPGSYQLTAHMEGYGSETVSVVSTGGVDFFEVSMHRLPFDNLIRLDRVLPFFAEF